MPRWEIARLQSTSADHPMARVAPLGHALFAAGSKKSASRIPRRTSRRNGKAPAASRAAVGAGGVRVPVRAGEGTFGVPRAGHGTARESGLPPLRIGLDDLLLISSMKQVLPGSDQLRARATRAHLDLGGVLRCFFTAQSCAEVSRRPCIAPESPREAMSRSMPSTIRVAG